MASKKEKQIERTKQNITTALLQLLTIYPLESITITQLCKKANVGRPTFYRHFLSTEDVLLQLSKKWFEEYLMAAKAAYEKVPRAETLDLVAFDFFRKNNLIAEMVQTKAFYNMLVGELGLRRPSIEKEFNLFDDESPYMLEYRVGGMIFVFARWFSGGMKESPEEMAEIFATIYRGMDRGSQPF